MKWLWSLAQSLCATAKEIHRLNSSSMKKATLHAHADVCVRMYVSCLSSPTIDRFLSPVAHPLETLKGGVFQKDTKLPSTSSLLWTLLCDFC